MTSPVIEKVASIHKHLLAKYGGKGKDLWDIFNAKEMSPEDSFAYAYMLNELEV